MFSFFEGKLKSLAEVLEDKIRPTIKLKDLKGTNDLGVYYKFLTRVILIKGDKWEKYFTPIQNVKILRNKLVHEDGLVTEKEIEIIQTTRGLTLHPSRQLFTIDDYQIFLTDLLNKIDLLFKNLIVAVEDHFKGRKK